MEKLAETHTQYGWPKTKLKTRDFHARVSVLLLRANIIIIIKIIKKKWVGELLLV